MRSLSPDEAELWARVAATIRPLSREPQPDADRAASAPAPAEETPAPTPRQLKPVAARRPQPPTQRETVGRTLDGTWDRKLGSGAIAPDRVLDLHGMNLDTAWRAIDRGLEQAIGAGDRVLLLITGHHRPGAPPVERGRIRAAVHDWLAASRHASRIAAVRGAHRRHGGGGSLYIVLRRPR